MVAARGIDPFKWGHGKACQWRVNILQKPWVSVQQDKEQRTGGWVPHLQVLASRGRTERPMREAE